jgi:hypothetical protein
MDQIQQFKSIKYNKIAVQTSQISNLNFISNSQPELQIQQHNSSNLKLEINQKVYKLQTNQKLKITTDRKFIN